MLGINTTMFKVAAFALSAVFASFAGGIIAYQNIHVTPRTSSRSSTRCR